MPKFSFCFNIYREEEYIEYSLRSVYDFADEIIICYGPVDVMADIGEPDRTLEIVRAFPDPANKIKHIEVRERWRSMIQMRNVALSVASGDYMWIIDGDEVYTPETLALIRDEIVNFPEVMTFLVPCYLFWQDFYTIMPNKSFERIHKITPGCVMVIPSLGAATAIGRRYRTISYIDLGDKYDALFWHYAYVRSDEYMRVKLEYYARRHDNYGVTKGVPNWYEGVWLASRTDMQAVMSKHGGLHPVLPTQWNRVYRYEGTHPSVMENHPYWSKRYIDGYNMPIPVWRPNRGGTLQIRQEPFRSKQELVRYIRFLNTRIRHCR